MVGNSCPSGNNCPQSVYRNRATALFGRPRNALLLNGLCLKAPLIAGAGICGPLPALIPL